MRVVSSIFCLEAALFVAQERRANQRHDVVGHGHHDDDDDDDEANAKALRAHLLRHLPCGRVCVQGGARVGQCCWGVFYRGIFLRADWIVVRLAGRADTHAYYRRQRKVAGGLQPGGAVRPQHGGRAAIFGGGASPCGLAVAVAAFPKGLAVEIASGWASLEIQLTGGWP